MMALSLDAWITLAVIVGCLSALILPGDPQTWCCVAGW